MRRVLLDENIPRGLKADFEGYEITTVPEAGWTGISNGDLLQQASGRFDVLVTADKNLPHQQSIEGLELGVVVLDTRSLRVGDLRSSVQAIVDAVDSVRTGEVLVVPI